MLRLGIRHRLIFLMAIAAGALAFDSYLDITSRRDQRVREVEDRMALAAQGAASRQYDFISAARLLLASLSRLDPDTNLCGQDFMDLTAGSEWLKGISIADVEGRLVCSSGPLASGVSVADRDYFKEAIRKRGFVLSDYVIGRVHKVPVLLAAAPRIDNDGRIEAVIILSVDVGWLNKVAEGIGDANTEVLLLDQKGTVAAANEHARGLIGRNVSDKPFFRKLLEHEGQVVSMKGLDGSGRIYTVSSLEMSQTRLVIGVPESLVLMPVDLAARQDFLKNALFFLVLFSIAWLLAERLILRPIRMLKHAASALGGADYSHRIDVGSLPADFDELAQTINTTAELLERKEDLIVEQNRRLRDANRQLADLASRDELTGLANRRALNDRLHDVFRRPAIGKVALLIVDLDKFKPVNDLMGHQAGDAVLKEAAERLRKQVNGEELAARLGGDEFALVVSCAEDPERASKVARAVVDALAEPFSIASGRVDIGATVGVAFAERDGANRSELLRAADLAMYAAKRSQRGSFCFFEASMGEVIHQKVAMECELRAGIKAGEIVPYFQPFIDLKSGRIVGFEVLARWHHPQRGVLTPDRFLHIVEETGLGEAMTRHLIDAVCRNACNWPDNLTFAVNLSPNQLGNTLLPMLISSIAIDWGIPPMRIEIEITEDALIKDFASAQTVIQSFRSFGMTVSLDDFGTGYSNLQNLHELRFDKLKIDRSFITDLAADGTQNTLVAAILAMARNLGLPTTAEGIEDAETAKLLADMGCTYAQGYFYSRPVPAREVPRLLGLGDADVRAGAA